MPQIATAGGQILTTLGQGISNLIPILGVLAYTILTTFLAGIIDHGPEALTAGTQMLTQCFRWNKFEASRFNTTCGICNSFICARTGR